MELHVPGRNPPAKWTLANAVEIPFKFMNGILTRNHQFENTKMQTFRIPGNPENLEKMVVPKRTRAMPPSRVYSWATVQPSAHADSAPRHKRAPVWRKIIKNT